MTSSAKEPEGEDKGARAVPVFDRAETPFSSILKCLVESTPGATGAVFADEEGETVDCFCEGEAYDVMLAAAHMGLLVASLERLGGKLDIGRLKALRLQAAKGQYVTQPLGQGYQVTVVLEKVATIPKLDRALDEAAVQLRLEAGGVID